MKGAMGLWAPKGGAPGRGAGKADHSMRTLQTTKMWDWFVRPEEGPQQFEPLGKDSGVGRGKALIQPAWKQPSGLVGGAEQRAAQPWLWQSSCGQHGWRPAHAAGASGAEWEWMGESNDAEWTGDGGGGYGEPSPHPSAPSDAAHRPALRPRHSHPSAPPDAAHRPALPTAASLQPRHCQSWLEKLGAASAHAAGSLEVEVVERVPSEWPGDWLRECEVGELVLLVYGQDDLVYVCAHCTAEQTCGWLPAASVQLAQHESYHEFLVRIRPAPGDPAQKQLGLVLADPVGPLPGVVVADVLPGSLLDEWNEHCRKTFPRDQVIPGDHVTWVNDRLDRQEIKQELYSFCAGDPAAGRGQRQLGMRITRLLRPAGGFKGTVQNLLARRDHTAGGARARHEGAEQHGAGGRHEPAEGDPSQRRPSEEDQTPPPAAAFTGIGGSLYQ